jgi:diguanylate cyclase (GGDEF)-like protein/PAS domain S-box-containing protein
MSTVRRRAREVWNQRQSLQALVTSNADAMLVVDAGGDILFASPAAEQLFGVDAVELVGRQFGRPLAPGTAELRIRHPEGARIAEMRVTDIEWADRRAFLASVRDVTERHAALEALELATNQLQAVLAASPVAVVVIDRDGRVRIWNRGAQRIFGWRESQVLARPVPIVVVDDGDEIWDRVAGGEQLEDCELRCTTRSGLVLDVSMSSAPLMGPDGIVAAGVAVLTDVTERRRQEEEIRHLASHDPLTGLANRRAMEANLERMTHAGERGERSAVLMLDLDRFKEVNDAAGHLVGDDLLRALADVLHRPLRPGDLLSRLGGDEFAVLAPGVGAAEAREIGERLVAAVRTFRFSHGDAVFSVRLSAGVGLIDGTLTPEEVLAVADAALYAAKDAGGDSVVVQEGPPAAAPQRARRWTERIRSALHDRRIVVHFQPIVRLDSNRVEYLEALPRIREGRRMVLPAAFIPEAERAGLIERIDRWVVMRAVEVLAEDPGVPIFVNVSSASVEDGTIIDLAADVLARHGVAPDRLGFEMTERDVNADIERGGDFVDRLALLGCRLAIDDFGAGFASFSYLRPLHAEYVKIDGSFVRAVRSDPQSRAIVEAIAAVAHALGKKVVAECVETPEIVSAISDLGVECGQGHRFARPKARKSAAAPARRR